MKKVDAVIIVPSVTYALTSTNNLPSLGICYVKSYLELSGYKSIIIDNYLEKNSDSELFSMISDNYVFKVLAIYIPSRSTLYSFVSWYIKYSYFFKEHIIVLGGPFASIASDAILKRFSFVDFVVKNLAEESIKGIIDYCYGKILKEEIPGVIFFDVASGTSLMNAESKISLDSLPLPDYTYYYEGFEDINYTVSTSRGCSNNCIYCINNCFYQNKKLYHSYEYVLNNIQKIFNMGIRKFAFIDDNFYVNKSIFNNFDTFLDSLPEGISFSISMRISDILKEKNKLKKMQGYGLKKIFIGIESFSNKTLSLFNKGINADDIYNALDFFNEIDLNFSYGFIFFHPWNTIEEMEENIRHLRYIEQNYSNLKISSPVQKIDVHYNTALYYKVKEEGLLIGDIFSGYDFLFKDKKMSEILLSWNKQNEKLLRSYTSDNHKLFILSQLNTLESVIHSYKP